MARRHQRPDQHQTRAQWRRWENVGLAPRLGLDDLVLNWTDRRVSDLDAKGALVALSLDRTIDGASTVTMTLRDPRGRVFSERARRMRDLHPERGRVKAAYKRHPVEVDEGWNPLLAPDEVGRAMEVELDGVVFRLVQARYAHSDQELELTFEDRIIYWLRRKRGPRRANRAKVTRAEFIHSLLREVKAARGRYRWVCPEEHDRQAIDKPRSRHALVAVQAASSAKRRRHADPEDTEGGFAPSAHLTVKGATATRAQRRRMAGILNEARRLGASSLVQAACIACATQESVMGLAAQMTGNDDVGLYQQGRNWINAGDTMDPALTTRAFLTGAINGGGAPGWKDIHGSLVRCPGGFEAAIKRVQVSVGGYRAWQAEAERTVAAFSGGEGEAAARGSASGARWRTKRYQYARNSDENSWTAMQRLSQEVGWRCFVVGRSVYYMSEQQLYRRRPRYEVHPDDPAVLDLTYDIDWGKPTSEAQLTVALDRWGAPPGSVVMLTGWGPPDGRWLVSQVSRDWFSPSATVTIKQPGKELLEPANERVQRAAQGGGGEAAAPAAPDARGSTKAQQAYSAARSISQRGLPYTWGGGHARCGTPDGGTGRDRGPGYDCSGSVCAVLAAAGMGYRIGGPADVSGTMAASWGQSGRGRQMTVWANSGHVWIQWHGLGAWRFDTSPYGSGGLGPHQRTTPRPTAGFVARHWPGV